MTKPDVRIIVCGRFHYHKYLHLVFEKWLLNKFIYSYRVNYHFKIPKKYLRNFPVKEYMIYLGKKILKAKAFDVYVSFLHRFWQFQVLGIKPAGNIVHFLVHGNCYKIIRKYRKKGIKIVGEVVNA